MSLNKKNFYNLVNTVFYTRDCPWTKSLELKDLKVYLEYHGPIKAPIKKDQEIGLLKISYKGDLIDEYPVYAVEKVKRVNVFSRILHSINYLIWGDV